MNVERREPSGAERARIERLYRRKLIEGERGKNVQTFGVFHPNNKQSLNHALAANEIF